MPISFSRQLPDGWREAVAAIAWRTRNVLLAHPWSLASLNDAQFGPNAMRHVEQSLAALDALDLDAAEKLRFGESWTITCLEVFSVPSSGSRTPRQRRTTRTPGGCDHIRAAATCDWKFPRLATLDRKQPVLKQVKRDKKSSQPMAAALSIQFERGLKAILDGLADSMKPVGSLN